MSDKVKQNLPDPQKEKESDQFTPQNVLHLINTIFNRMDQLEQKIADRRRTSIDFFKWRYWQDIILVVILLAAILIAAHYEFTDKSTNATLMGSVVGFSLARFSNRERK